MFWPCMSHMIENKDPVDIIYFDFRKAFDTVPHVRLLKKIRSLWYSGQVAKLD